MANTPELLAPAGSLQAVIAAVRTGADAVYFGAKAFNARRNAENFDDEALATAIRYCHSRGVKVHITLNTLISDAELPSAKEVLRHVCALGADVLILQDLGLADLAKEAAPALARHASTQMSVQTPQGVQLLQKLGYARAVLPRELTKAEIAEIRRSTDMELEMFIHGAQCMCVSGQCYLSAMLGARSGNRGLCAQPCRLAFSAGAPGRHDLSLRDLSLMDRLAELRALGVDSFKIEGRMKRPEYVAAAVTNARNALAGTPDADLSAALEAVFSRSGFTSGYYDDQRGKAMFGIRRKEDVTAASGKVLSSLARLYEKETPRVPVAFFLSVLRDEPPTLTAKANGKTVFVTDEVLPEPAINKPLTEDALRTRLTKCGGTPFFADSIEIELDEGLILPAGVINGLRRSALEQLEAALSNVKLVPFTDSPIFPDKPRELSRVYTDQTPENRRQKLPKFCVRVANDNQIPDNLDHVENLILPLNFKENSVETVKNRGISTAVEIPRGIFGNTAAVEKALARAKRLGISIAYCSTLDAVALAQNAGMQIYTGFAMNVFNSRSVKVLEDMDVKRITLSPELTLQQISRIHAHVPLSMFAYGNLPLMLTRNCPIRNVKSCADCNGRSVLTDRMGVQFPVTCTLGCSEVLNSRPIYLADRLHEICGVDFLTLYFTNETKEEADAVLTAYRAERPSDRAFTRGLTMRGVE